jgi:hypothetical protein
MKQEVTEETEKNSPPARGLPIVSTPWEPGAAGFASVDDLGAMPLDDSRSPPQGLRAACGNARIWDS